MTPALVQREAALAAVALVAALATLAATDSPAHAPSTASPPPQTVTTAGNGWYQAVVGSYGRGRYGRPTACGVTLERATLGIAHPVLPCGAKILVRFDGREAEAAVIDKGLETDHDFDLTAALAAELGVDGTQRVRWRFAGG